MRGVVGNGDRDHRGDADDNAEESQEGAARAATHLAGGVTPQGRGSPEGHGRKSSFFDWIKTTVPDLLAPCALSLRGAGFVPPPHARRVSETAGPPSPPGGRRASP